MSYELIFGEEQKILIKVVGVGNAGGNAINYMIDSGMQGVDFVAIDTDAQALETRVAGATFCISEESISNGLKKGVQPGLVRQAIQEDSGKMTEYLRDADLVFIIAGMGGEAGTSIAPAVAQVAREKGALTVGIVTEPFAIEGIPRMHHARVGISELRKHVDVLIIIKNQRLLADYSNDILLPEAFAKSDEVLMQATRGIADLLTVPWIIEFWLSDMKYIFSDGGDTIMGVGAHRGENRAIKAAMMALEKPLFEEVSIEAAEQILVNFTGDSNLGLDEVHEAMWLIYEEVGREENISFGMALDESLAGEIRVTIFATGFSVID